MCSLRGVTFSSRGTLGELSCAMASLAINNGIPIEAVAKMRNWKSDIIKSYARFSHDTMRQGATAWENIFSK